MRGFTIKTSSGETPAGLIAPGDFIDVLVALNSNASSYAATLLQNVRVLAVEREVVNRDTPYDSAVRGAISKDANVSHITLVLTPDQS